MMTGNLTLSDIYDVITDPDMLQQLEEYREFFESRGFALFDTVAAKNTGAPSSDSLIVQSGNSLMPAERTRWCPSRRNQNKPVWDPDQSFATPLEAFIFGELENWGRS